MTFSLNFRDLHKLFIVLLSTIILVTYLLFKFKKNNDLIVDSYKEILDLYSTCENNELDKKENIDDNLNKYKVYMILLSSIILLICLLLKFKKNIVDEDYIDKVDNLEEEDDEDYIEEDEEYIEEEDDEDYIEEDEEYIEEEDDEEYLEETEEEEYDEEYLEETEEEDDYIEETEEEDDYIEETEEDDDYIEEEDKHVSNNKIKKVNLLLDKFEK
jgi:hypothetical protein